MRKEVRVTVNEDGTTQTDYRHFEGMQCLAAAERFHTLLEQLGVQVHHTRRTPKPELRLVMDTQQALTDETMTDQETEVHDER